MAHAHAPGSCDRRADVIREDVPLCWGCYPTPEEEAQTMKRLKTKHN